MEILSGHTSPETAYTVADYPYGFRLRCKIRYWLEHHPTRGTRFMSQTTNPKRPVEFWNKPKASTYAFISGAMYLNHENHVTWSALNEYASLAECHYWKENWKSGLTPAALRRVELWIERKTAYEKAKAERSAKK